MLIGDDVSLTDEGLVDGIKEGKKVNDMEMVDSSRVDSNGLEWSGK